MYGFTERNYSIDHFSINANISELLIRYNALDPIIINRFINTLKKSGRVSIDKFLRNQSDGWDTLGKKLIGFIIGLYESKCDPFSGVENGFHDYSESIYHYLFEKMDASNQQKMSENNVRFITFNYDRCLEYFFLEAIRVNYPDEVDDFENYLEKNIIHVHGSLGKVTQDFDLLYGRIPYGIIFNHKNDSFSIDLSNYGFLGQNIRIVTDEIQSSIKEKCSTFFKWANRIIFIGFAYDIQNLNNIGFNFDNRELLSNKDILGSSYGFTQREISEIKSYLKRSSGSLGIVLEESGRMKSVEFLRNYLTL